MTRDLRRFAADEAVNDTAGAFDREANDEF